MINKLRRNAHLPDYLQEYLNRLPYSMHEIIAKIRMSQLAEWEETIAEHILDKMKDRLEDLFEYQTLSEL